MSQLVAYYEDQPVVVKGMMEIRQEPISAAAGVNAVDGAIQTSLVYVVTPSAAGPLLIPFGEYDEWSLRGRYNEAIRIMNSLGASSIKCETYQEVSVRRGFRAKVLRQSGELIQQRVENSGFDFTHNGAGSAPRDPRPLLWPDEPGFAAAVSSVLENGAVAVEINIKSNHAHSVDGTLGVQLKRLGFELGGMSQHSGTTSLHIAASFPQSRRSWK